MKRWCLTYFKGLYAARVADACSLAASRGKSRMLAILRSSIMSQTTVRLIATDGLGCKAG